MASSAENFANYSVAAVKGQELRQRKRLCCLPKISSNERNRKQTFKSSEFMLVKHLLFKTGRKSYLYNFYWKFSLAFKVRAPFTLKVSGDIDECIG